MKIPVDPLRTVRQAPQSSGALGPTAGITADGPLLLGRGGGGRRQRAVRAVRASGQQMVDRHRTPHGGRRVLGPLQDILKEAQKQYESGAN